MNEFLVAAGGCLLAGVMTTLHPCPFTTNMASVSMLIGWSTRGRKRGFTFFFFIAGYLCAYLLLAILLSSGSLSIPRINNILQILVHLFLGPSLILIGMLLADLLNLNRLYHGRILSRIRTENWSGFSAFPFGILIALRHIFRYHGPACSRSSSTHPFPPPLCTGCFGTTDHYQCIDDPGSASEQEQLYCKVSSGNKWLDPDPDRDHPDSQEYLPYLRPPLLMSGVNGSWPGTSLQNRGPAIPARRTG